MSQPADLPELSPFPPRPRCHLRTGISGHRLQTGRSFDVDVVHRAMATIFDDTEAWLAALNRHGYDPEPSGISLISALADGADQMAVTAFTERAPNARLKRRLEVVIPFAPDAYAETFHEPAAAAVMRSQLTQADTVMVLGDWTPLQGAKASPFTVHWRDQRYASVGNVVVRQSDLLLAVWDGMAGAGPGGTAHTVALAIAESIPVVSIHPKTGALRLITKHTFAADGSLLSAGDDIISNDLFLAYDQLTTAYSPERLGAILNAIVIPPPAVSPRRSDDLEAFFTREPVRSSSRAVLYNWLFSARASLSLATDHVHRGLGSWQWQEVAKICGCDRLFGPFAAAWSHADAVATRLGHHYRSTYIAIFCAATLATLSGLLGLPVHALVPAAREEYFVVAELLILCIGLVIYWGGRSAHQHKRWLNARELAEQMRAHWALGLIGLGGRRVVPDNPGWTAWLFNAYAAPVGVPGFVADNAALTRIAEVIQSEIVKDQARYHRKNQHSLDVNHKKLEVIGNLSLVLAMVSSVTLIIYLLNEHRFESEAFRFGMIAASAALPSIGAAATGIRFQGDFERFAWRSGQTWQALLRIDRQLDQFIFNGRDGGGNKPRYEDLRDIVTRLEQVLLSDLDDWRFVYEARPDPGVG